MSPPASGGLALLAVPRTTVLGASALATRFGVSILVVGVVVIGVGTSMPELPLRRITAPPHLTPALIDQPPASTGRIRGPFRGSGLPGTRAAGRNVRVRP
jgi:hypothetical protein